MAWVAGTCQEIERKVHKRASMHESSSFSVPMTLKIMSFKLSTCDYHIIQQKGCDYSN